MGDLVQCSANYNPLSPVCFLKRAALIYGDRVSIVYGSLEFSWRETYERCLKLASALVQLDISPGDIVAAFAPNIPELYELHFAVAMAGAVISPLNTKQDTFTLASIFQQLQPKFIFVDYQFLHVVLRAVNFLSNQNPNLSHIILIPDSNQTSNSTIEDQKTPFEIKDYSTLLSMGNAEFKNIQNLESDPISVNYTSGSTGDHKGVVYSHRATYLNSLATIFRCKIRRPPVFLWTVDMFRCNGWCFIWAVAALGGTNICIRNVSANLIFDSIFLHNVTHLCGPPTILKAIAESERITHTPLANSVDLIIAGPLPVPEILRKITAMGFNLSHGYGMTEVLGPAIITPWTNNPKNEEDPLPNSRFFYEIHNLIMEVDVKDPKSMNSVPNDGKTLGEIMFKGNTIMSGYFKNPKATKQAFKEDWYRTGDVGIRHPNGNVQMKDRLKDMIRNGEEAISTIEVESVLLSHPKVLEAAVVGKVDGTLRERSAFAYVKIKDGFGCSEEEIMGFCVENLPSFMVPCGVVFGDLPVNSTGKVQKFVLRENLNGF